MSTSGFGLSRPNSGPTPLAAIDDKSIKGGNLFISDLTFPSEVGPNESVTVNLTVSNGAIQIESDPDQCFQGLFGGNGYNVEVTVNTGWASDDREYCHGTTEIGTADRDHTFEFTAPDPSSTTSYNLLIRLETPESGQSLTLFRNITVFPSSAVECTSDADCPGSQVCQNGECVTPDDGGNGGDGCTSNAGCPGSQVCQNGTCVEPDDDDDPSGGLFGLSQTEMIAGAGVLVGLGLLYTQQQNGGNSNSSSRSRRSSSRRENY